ncbi:MAG: ArnT family glycosyltransferase [Acidobacteriota bacterium]
MLSLRQVALDLAIVGLLFSSLRLCGQVCHGILRLGGDQNTLDNIALGGIVAAWLIFAAQTFGGYGQQLALLLLGIGLLGLFDRRWWMALAQWRTHWRQMSWLDRAALGSTVVSFAGAGVASLAPPVAKDALVYHLTVQKTYLAAGHFVELPHNIFAYFPQLVEGLYACGLSVGSDRTAALVHTGFGFLLCLATYRLARASGLSTTGGWLATAILASTPMVWLEAGWPYVDLVLTFYVVQALHWLLIWHTTGQMAGLVLAGVFFGGAASTKYLALPLALALIPVLLGWRSPQPSLGRVIQTLALFFGPLLVVAAPWYGRNLWLVHNPVFPLLYTQFPTQSAGWDAERARLHLLFLQGYGSAVKDWFDYLTLPWRVCWLARTDDIRHYDGEIGAVYFLLVPALGLWQRMGSRLRGLAVFAVLSFVQWALSSQQVRFLLPVLPPVAVISVWFAADWLGVNRRLRWIGVVCLGLFITANALRTGELAVEGQAIAAGLGVVPSEEYLRSRLPEYGLFRFLADHADPQTRIWLVNTGARTYYLERPFLTDYAFEDYTLARLVRATRTADELAEAVAQLDVDWLLIAPSIVLDPQTTPFENEAERTRFVAYLRRYATLVGQDGRLALFRLERIGLKSTRMESKAG